MGKANTLKALAAATFLTTIAPAQTSEQLYKDLMEKNTSKEISAPEATPLDGKTISVGQNQTPEDSLQLRSHTNKSSSAPIRTVIKPTDHGLAGNNLNSVYFDPSDSTAVLGCASGGMTVKDTVVTPYVASGTCYPIICNGYSSYKKGDTIYRGTQSNSGIGGLVKQVKLQSTGGCSVNNTILLSANSKITSIEEYQGNKYVATSLDGLCVLDGNDTIIQRYTSQNSSLPTNTITKLSNDNQGNLWVATGSGLIKITGSVRTIYNNTNTGISGFSSGLTDVKVDNAGSVRCGNAGLYKYTPGFGWSQVTVPFNSSQGPLNILSVEVDQFGCIIITTKYHGVLIFDPSTNQWTTYDINNSPLTTNRVNDDAVDTTSSTKRTLFLATDATGLLKFEQDITPFLPQIPAGAHITGQDTVTPGQTYTYALSTPITNAQKYIWSYTGTGVTSITPILNGTAVQIVFASGATAGDIICKAQNNYTKPVTDTVQLTFTIHDIMTGIDEYEAQEKVVVAPNPTTDIISVLNMQKKNIKSAEIYTMDWKQVKKQSIGRGEEVRIDVADLPAGSYVMLLKDIRGKGYTVKFIKQ